MPGQCPSYLRDYHEYVGSLFSHIQDLRLKIQSEHTLVMPGGRDSAGFPQGKIPTGKGDFYLVRLSDHQQFEACDYVIDYSLPNLHNIKISGRFTDIARKLAYVPPLLFPYTASPRHEIELLTLFIDINQPRRKALIEKLGNVNVTNCYGDDLRRLFLGTKVLVNIHQTDHHHTLEELRILPALLSGVMVISEDVPCRELVPYHEFIIWTDYDHVADTVQDVAANYDAYFLKTFGPQSALPQVLDEMKHATLQTVAFIEADLRRRQATRLPWWQRLFRRS